ncbi:MAG: Hpt domain-containing protein, partial [Desulfovibrionaceae bacterium]
GVAAAGEVEGAQVLDRQRLLDRYGGDKELVGELYRAFQEDAPVKLARLKEGRESGDLEAMGRMAHSLKGVAGVIFANRTMRLAAELQDSAMAGEAERSWELADRVGEAMAEVLEELGGES